jgi:hypothetical protein
VLDKMEGAVISCTTVNKQASLIRQEASRSKFHLRTFSWSVIA